MNILQIQVQNTFKHKNTIVKFKDGVNLLRDKLAEKIVLMDHLQLHICPNLDTDYILKFGSLKYKIETNKIECEKIKMKIGLMEKQLNRKSRLNLFEIDEQVENEFRKQTKMMMIEKLTRDISCVLTSSLSYEDKADKMNQINESIQRFKTELKGIA